VAHRRAQGKGNKSLQERGHWYSEREKGNSQGKGGVMGCDRRLDLGPSECPKSV